MFYTRVKLTQSFDSDFPEFIGQDQEAEAFSDVLDILLD